MTTIGRKYDSGKPEFSLLPPWALESVAKVLTFGAQKYDVDNWKHVSNGEYRYRNAALRHINDYVKGEKTDRESGCNHLAHAICCLMFILDADESGQPLAPAESKTVDKVIGKQLGFMDKWFDVSQMKVNYAFATPPTEPEEEYPNMMYSICASTTQEIMGYTDISYTTDTCVPILLSGVARPFQFEPN